MGTSQDYRVAVEEGATYVRVGSTLFEESPTTAVTFRATMGFADVWNKTLVYFGIAEEEDWDEDGYLTDEELQRAYADRPNVRRLRSAPAPRGVRRLDRSGALGGPDERPPAGARAARGSAASRACRAAANVTVHLVLPRSFNDAQQIADRFKEGVPVILNLQGSDQELVEAPDRLRQRPDVRARRRHAARRRQGLPADAAKRRGVRRRARTHARARRLLQPGLAVGKAPTAANGAPMGVTATPTLLADAIELGEGLSSRLRARLHARHLRLHPFELAAAAVLAVAQPDPTLPVRRFGAVSAAVPAHPAVDGPARPLADGGDDRRCGSSTGCDHAVLDLFH